MAPSFLHPFAASLLHAQSVTHGPSRARPHRGLLLRVGKAALDTLVEARRREAERVIAWHVERHGSWLTDDVERRISWRFGDTAR